MALLRSQKALKMGHFLDDFGPFGVMKWDSNTHFEAILTTFSPF